MRAALGALVNDLPANELQTLPGLNSPRSAKRWYSSTVHRRRSHPVSTVPGVRNVVIALIRSSRSSAFDVRIIYAQIVHDCAEAVGLRDLPGSLTGSVAEVQIRPR